MVGNMEARTTSLVSMMSSYKKHLTKITKAHGLSLSTFFCLASDEHIVKHD